MKRATCIVTLLTFALLLSGFSCNKQNVAVGARDIAVSVRSFQVAEIESYQQGFISDAEHFQIQKYLKAVAISGKAADECIKSGAGPTCMDGGIAAVKDMIDSSIFPLGNTEKRQQLMLAAQLILATFQNLKAAL